VKATVADPKGAVLVHLGSSDFLERFRIYVSHVQEWRAQFAVLKSVDLRYQHQVIVNPDETSNASLNAAAQVSATGSAPPVPGKNNKANVHAKAKAKGTKQN
jgi:hypothetical protein